MQFENVKYALWKIGIMLLCVGLLLQPAAGSAQDSKTGRPDFYPVEYSGQGCIDRISDDFVVIDDRMLRFSFKATYHTPNRHQASSYDFSKGQLVGYIKNSDNEIESLWYIENCRN